MMEIKVLRKNFHPLLLQNNTSVSCYIMGAIFQVKCVFLNSLGEVYCKHRLRNNFLCYAFSLLQYFLLRLLNINFFMSSISRLPCVKLLGVRN